MPDLQPRPRPLHALVRADGVNAALTFCGMLALYVRTLAPGLVYGDGAEFQTLSYTLGMTHPTGYPIYLLIGKLFTLLPVRDVAYRINLMSAVFAALSVALLYLVGRVLGGRRIAAFLGAVVLGTNWLFWWHAVMAETYAMATALLIGILLLVLVWRATDKAGYLFGAGALGGLSIGVHNTVALAAPAILVYLLLTARRRSAWLAATAGAGLGLALMLAAFAWVGGVETPASYYNTTLRFSLRSMGIDPFRSVADRMWFMLSGRQYRGRMFSSPQATMANLARAYLKYLAISFSVLGIALAGAGWLSACVRRWRETVLITLSLAVVLIFVLNYSIKDIYVFFIPTYVFVALLIGLGVGTLQDGLASAWQRWAPARARAGEVAVRGAGVLCLAWAAALGAPAILPTVQAGHITMLNRMGPKGIKDGPEDYPYPIRAPEEPERQARAMVERLDRGAILFDDWDRLHTYYYVALVEGIRPDLEFMELWDFGSAEAYRPLFFFLDTRVARQPVYLSQRLAAYGGLLSTLKAHYRLEPAADGTLWRILPRE